MKKDYQLDAVEASAVREEQMLAERMRELQDAAEGYRLCSDIDSYRRFMRARDRLDKNDVSEIIRLANAGRILEWACNNPVPVMSEIRSWWTMCGQGGREDFFNFTSMMLRAKEKETQRLAPDATGAPCAAENVK